MGIFIKNQDSSKTDIMTAEGVHSIVHELIKDSKYILDVGCGTGVFSVQAQKDGHQVEACGLEDCKFSNVIPFKKVDFNTQPLPYMSDTFDGCIAIEIAEHLFDTHTFIQELHRVVKKGGVVVLTTPNLQNWYQRLYFLFTGCFLGFYPYEVKPKDPENNHISPILLQIYKSFIEKYFIIEKITTNRSFIPLVRIKLPFTNMFFSDTLILKLRKK